MVGSLLQSRGTGCKQMSSFVLLLLLFKWNDIIGPLGDMALWPILMILVHKFIGFCSKYTTLWKLSKSPNLFKTAQNSKCIKCLLYMRHYKLRLVFFLPHFSLRFITKSSFKSRAGYYGACMVQSYLVPSLGLGIKLLGLVQSDP